MRAFEEEASHFIPFPFSDRHPRCCMREREQERESEQKATICHVLELILCCEKPCMGSKALLNNIV
jgi:hypothetical protein